MKSWEGCLFAIFCCFLYQSHPVLCRYSNKNYVPKNSIGNSSDYGKPLFLTPYLLSKQVQKARELSQVGELPNVPNVLSYSGFFTVYGDYNSNMFFWFFPAMNKDKNAPVILWLQGGPGSSGLLGLFNEHGPYAINANNTAEMRKYHWAEFFSIIYVDSPMGTGFSFTDKKAGYCQNQERVAEDLYEFLQQFFFMFSEYRSNDFYIAGESFSGKYVPFLAWYIHQQGPSSKLNLKGVMIGSGMCDPETMLDYSDYFYQLGLVDKKQAVYIRNASNSIVQLIRNKDFFGALVELDKLIGDYKILHYKGFFRNSTGFEFFYNYLYTQWPVDYEYAFNYIRLPSFRKAVHVGNLTFQSGKSVQKYLELDIMRSVKDPEVQTAMDNYRVLFYNGQLDLIVPYPLTLNFLHSVKWKHAKEYEEAERQIWKLEGTDTVAGYVHNVGDFYEVLVRNAGHMVPHDQPEVALDMITRFIKKKPYA